MTMKESKSDHGYEDINFIQFHDLYFSKIRVIKNVIVLCGVFLITFTAYDCLVMLQSTLNHDKGIGVVCQSIIYGCFCVSSLFFPKYFIKKLGCKLTILLSSCAYVPYIISNIYPHWSLMVPTAILNGLSASLLWGSQCTYLNEIAVLYAVHSFKNEENKMEKHTARHDTAIIDPSNGTSSKDERTQNGNIHEERKSSDSVKVISDVCGHIPSEPMHSATIDLSKEAPPKNELAQSIKINEENKLCDPVEVQHVVDEESTNESFQVYRCTGKTYSVECGGNSASSKIQNTSQDSPNPRTASSMSLTKTVESTTARFFGIFGMAYLSCHLWSNLMSYFVLQKDAANMERQFNTSCVCGAQFCNGDSVCLEHNLLAPSQETRNLLTGLCVSLTIGALLLLLIFLDPLKNKKENVVFSWDLLMATGKHSKKATQIALIPLTFYIGMMQGFYTGDFTMSYVGCAWGTYHVGLVSVCYGAACAISSPLFGLLVRITGRIPVFSVAFAVNLAAQVILLTYKPTAETPFRFFLIAGLWGSCLGAFWSQMKAMYGILFKGEEEAAFAAFYLFYSLGFCLSYAYSNHFCTYIKIYLLMATLVLGMIGYLWVELRTKCCQTK